MKIKQQFRKKTLQTNCIQLLAFELEIIPQ